MTPPKKLREMTFPLCPHETRLQILKVNGVIYVCQPTNFRMFIHRFSKLTGLVNAIIMFEHVFDLI